MRAFVFRKWSSADTPQEKSSRLWRFGSRASICFRVTLRCNYEPRTFLYLLAALIAASDGAGGFSNASTKANLSVFDRSVNSCSRIWRSAASSKTVFAQPLKVSPRNDAARAYFSFNAAGTRIANRSTSFLDFFFDTGITPPINRSSIVRQNDASWQLEVPACSSHPPKNRGGISFYRSRQISLY